MGTRADFYVGRGETAEWIGSITWDGYPDGIEPAVLEATTEDDYRSAVTEFFNERDDVTLPTEPWPWPWQDSHTTDYAYAFDGGTVYGTFGRTWFVGPNEGAPDPSGATVTFPDMSSRKGSRDHIMAKSGLISVAFSKDVQL